MKRVQIFTMRDMPVGLKAQFGDLYGKTSGHIVEFYPLKDGDVVDEEEYGWARDARRAITEWLERNGLDQSCDPYRYVLITYQPE